MSRREVLPSKLSPARRSGALALLLLLAFSWADVSPSHAQTRASRAPNTAAGSCDGVLDYAGDLVPAAFQLESQTPLGGGLVRVEISAELSERAGADFAGASLFPDLSDHADLQVEPGSLLAADFEAIPTLGTAASVQTLVLELPANQVAELLARLDDGRLPVTVHADEVPVTQPGVRFVSWDSTFDLSYGHASYDHFENGWPLNVPTPPYAPDEVYEMTHILERAPSNQGPLPVLWPGGGDDFGRLEDVCENEIDFITGGSCQFTPGETVYLVPGPDPLTHIPSVMHRVRLVSMVWDTKLSVFGPQPFYQLEVQRTDLDPVASLYTSGSFCSGTRTHIDWPVQASRLHEIDGDEQEPEQRDGYVQPIRFNDIPFDGVVSVSGQVQGHVLKPSLELQVRPGRIRAVADIDTDLSLTAELRAAVTQPVSETAQLYDLCFPLASLPVGPINVALNLQLTHDLNVDGSIGAGAVVGFQKRFQGGLSVGYDSALLPDPFIEDSRHAQPHPVEFTPPQLSDDTAARMEVSTNIRTTLRIGAEYPFCDTGFGAYLDARGWGAIDVTPTQDPWWQIQHGAELRGGLDLQLFGLNIVDHRTAPLFEVGHDVRSAGAPPLGSARAALAPVPQAPGATTGRSEGADQRWAVGIDDTLHRSGIRHTSLAALPDGGAAVLTNEPVPRNHLMRLDRFGAMQWRVQYDGSAGYAPQQLIALPDDSILVVGTLPWLARHAADGSVLWATEYELTPQGGGIVRCSPEDLVYLEPEGEAPGVIVVGTTVFDGEPDGCAFRVDLDGNLLWARSYEEAGTQEFRAASVILAGDDGSEIMRIAVAGRTYSGPDVFSRNNALVAAIDPASGDLDWATMLNDGSRGGVFNAVTQGADGSLYLAGASTRTIRQTGAALVARISPDGSDLRAALVFQDEEWEQLLDFETFEDTQAGDTAYDEFFGISPAPGGFVVAGATGLAPKAAWAAKLNPNLGLEWFTTFDGSDDDVLDRIVVTPDGYLASGFSDSLEQVGQELDDRWLTVMKLPFAGSIDFRPDALLTSRYIEPGIRTLGSPYPATLDVRDSVVQSATPVAGLLIEPAPFCVVGIGEAAVSSGRVCIDDRDADGILDGADNCVDVPNPLQEDFNALADDDSSRDGVQHYGDACDADLDDDGLVGASDFFTVYRPCLGADLTAEPQCAVADLDGDGSVAPSDFFARLRPAFGTAPGPGIEEGS